MTEGRVEEAVLTIARNVGDDLVLLQPPDEKHVEPFTAVFGFAGLLAVSFMHGFIGYFRAEAESLGARTAQRIQSGLVHIFRGESETSVKGLEDLSREVRGAIAAHPDAATQAADAARMHLVEALIENGLPAERAIALAGVVQREALSASV